MTIQRTRPPYASDAEECRQRGFQVGDKLVGDEGYGPTVIEITAIGEKKILAKEISLDGKLLQRGEGCWTLSNRDWEPLPV